MCDGPLIRTGQLGEDDTLMLGRVTYELMAAYWPRRAGQESDLGVAAMMNSMSKIVVSRTLAQAEWANTRILSGNVEEVEEELARLKQQPGKNIAIIAISTLTADLLRMGLVDELRIMVSPVILGQADPCSRVQTRPASRS